MSPKKQQFLADVLHELTQLKAHATPVEISNLSLALFDHRRKDRCIYGLLTGNCESVRAKKLMDASCIRVMDLSNVGIFPGVDSINRADIDDECFQVNGEYAGQTWIGADPDRGSYLRAYRYLSALEAYICTDNANISGIISYLQGKTDTVEL